MADIWTEEDRYWRENYQSRPYARSTNYDSWSGAYRYGCDAATKYSGRAWDDVEFDLERDWNSYQYRGQSTWQQVKNAVRDAWDRMTGHNTPRSRTA